MFDMHDHNKEGTQKEVGQCCNCLYNDHGAYKYHPAIFCHHPESLIKTTEGKVKEKLIAVVYDDKKSKHHKGREKCNLVESDEYKEQLTGFPIWCPLEKVYETFDEEVCYECEQFDEDKCYCEYREAILCDGLLIEKPCRGFK